MDDARFLNALRRYWDEIARGGPATSGDLDPELAATIRRLHALPDVPSPDPTYARRLRENLMHATTVPLPRIDSVAGPGRNGRSMPTLRRAILPSVPSTRGRWALAQLATAALLLLAFLGSFLVFGPGRPGRQIDTPAILPAISGTPATPRPEATETLLQESVAAMPAGAAGIWVNAYVMQPGAVSPHDGAVSTVVFKVERGMVTVTLADTQRTLKAGETWSVQTQAGYAIENSGPDEARLFTIDLMDAVATPTGANANGAFIDPMGGTWDAWIEVATTLPGGAGQLTLERLTLAPGAALPAYTQAAFDWLGIDAGRLTVRLEGERLPFRWKSGAERTFAAGQIPPLFPAGAQVTVRNAGDDPLVLYRLTIEPSAAGAAGDGTPISQ